MKLKIAHLSDPHFGTVFPQVEAALKKTLREIAPDLILISGDITQRARYRQFRAARRFVKELGATPVISIPGNHDIPLFNIFARLFWPNWGFHHAFHANTGKDFRHEHVHVIALNSTSRWRHVQGALDLTRVNRRLTASPKEDRLRIVVFHHPLDCAKGIDEKNLLKNRDEAIELFAQHNVDLILGGHVHDPFVSLSTERYPQTKRAMLLTVAGTCLSWRTRAKAPNSFNLIETETNPKGDRSIDISRYDIREDHFSPIEVRHFTRADSTGWHELK